MNSDSILKSYLTDKGATNVTDRNSLEVLKELLRKENNGIYSERVESCRYITTETLPIDSIQLGNKDHFNRVEARELNSPNGGPIITGVVVRDSRGDRIVDGYHRLKQALHSDLRDGMFIVISAIEI